MTGFFYDILFCIQYLYGNFETNKMKNYKEGWAKFMRMSVENRKMVKKGISKLEDTQMFADIEKKATEGMSLVRKMAEEIKEKLRAKNNK